MQQYIFINERTTQGKVFFSNKCVDFSNILTDRSMGDLPQCLPIYVPFYSSLLIVLTYSAFGWECK